jgi:transposase InsO family protein
VNFKTKEYVTSKPLELLHTNLCGPSRTKILQGERYFMLLINDYTIMTWDTFLNNKFEEFDKFKAFKSLVENKIEMKIKNLRSENGGEFTSNKYVELFEEHGIKRKYAVPRTPQKNGFVERKNRHVQ